MRMVGEGDLSDALKGAMEEAEVVSFDIFDTALLRSLDQPADLFFLVGLEAGLSDPHAFVQARIEAEKLARKRAWKDRGMFEVLLDDIYRGLEWHPSIQPKGIRALLNKERELELRLSRRHPLIGEAFEWAKSSGKKI